MRGRKEREREDGERRHSAREIMTASLMEREEMFVLDVWALWHVLRMWAFFDLWSWLVLRQDYYENFLFLLNSEISVFMHQ